MFVVVLVASAVKEPMVHAPAGVFQGLYVSFDNDSVDTMILCDKAFLFKCSR